jgi:peptidoglycan/xylan/chitin deacetylase (PgdA/CDA1 family)
MPNRLVGALNRALATRIRRKSARIEPARPVASFTFDDAPASAATLGAEALESAGFRGTYYVAGGLCGLEEEGAPILSVDDLVRLHRAGHEIACHTFSHIRVSGLGRQQFQSELDRNRSFMAQECPGATLANFSYPFGDVSLSRKRQAEGCFESARGISPGVNSGVIDLGLLKSVALYSDSIADAQVDGYFDRARRENGWLIFYTHDVGPRPSRWGSTMAQLERTVATAKARGFDVLTVRDALNRLVPAEHGRPS